MLVASSMLLLNSSRSTRLKARKKYSRKLNNTLNKNNYNQKDSYKIVFIVV